MTSHVVLDIPIEMVAILSEDVDEPIIVGLTPGQVDGCGIQVLLEQCLQLCLGVILVQTYHLERGGQRRLKPMLAAYLTGVEMCSQ